MKRILAVALAVSLSAGTVQAQTYSFGGSVAPVGFQYSNVGSITLTQFSANTVRVLVNLINDDRTTGAYDIAYNKYGFLNTGGPHTPFSFNLSGLQTGVTASFITPAVGNPFAGTFSLNTLGGSNTPYGTFGMAINYSGGNGSSNAYFGDLSFDVTRTSGLLTNEFIKNLPDGYYFGADITNNVNTGAQGWSSRTSVVPEPATVALMASGLLVLGFAAKRKRA